MCVVRKATTARFLRGAAFLVIAGAAAGCSSGSSRFSDDFYTGSVKTVRPPEAVTSQPFPARRLDPVDTMSTGSTPRAVQPAPMVSAGSVQRSELPAPTPVTGSQARQAAAPLLAPVADEDDGPLMAKASQDVDTMTTGGVMRSAPAVREQRTEPAAPMASETARPAPSKTEGWSTAGGTYVQLGSGETIYNLSRRFGVPANAIMEANGITDASSVQAGQKLLIPTYVYSRTAPVSAPDADPKTASAKASTGTKYDIPAGKVPLPDQAPSRDVAVLPTVPATRQKDSSEQTASSPQAATREPVKTASAAPSASGVYVVEKGDTLYGIARKTGVPVAALKEANGLGDGYLKVGQKLALAGGAAQVDPIITGSAKSAKSGETAKPVAVAKSDKLPQYTPPKADETVIAKAEKQTSAKAPDATGIGKMRWPAKGRVITAYGARAGAGTNDGIDIAVPQGTPVKAAENGVVIYAGDGLKEFGKTVLVRHENGLVSVYGHNGEIDVQRGDTVKRGQQIARSGMSGDADTPKLHFEVRKNSKPVDPMGYLD